MFDAPTDLAVAWCWVPFFAAAHLSTIRTEVAAAADLGTVAPACCNSRRHRCWCTATGTSSRSVDPAAGLIAIIASHAIEYSIVVMRTLHSRDGNQTERTSILSGLAGSTARRWALLAVFFAAFWLLDDRMRDGT